MRNWSLCHNEIGIHYLLKGLGRFQLKDVLRTRSEDSRCSIGSETSLQRKYILGPISDVRSYFRYYTDTNLVNPHIFPFPLSIISVFKLCSKSEKALGRSRVSDPFRDGIFKTSYWPTMASTCATSVNISWEVILTL